MEGVRREMRRRLFELAAEQRGLFTATQAREVGYSHQAQAHHVRAGNWLRIDRGIFRLADWVPEIDDDLARWVLWARGRAVISHETALAVHDIGEFEHSRVDLTVPRGFTMRNEAVRLHHAELPPEDIAQRVGFRVTTPERSLIDVAATEPDGEHMARAIDEAVDRGLVSIRRLRSRADAIDARAALHIERALRRIEAA